MTLSQELIWRGQIKDTTFSDISWLDEGANESKVFYLGSDPSSDSLTIGNLAIYMLARRLRKHGWKAIMLVGGATSLIGDPGGKDTERELKSYEDVQHNVKGIATQIQTLFKDLDFELVDNYDWFKDIGYLNFLRDIGKHFSMTELMQRDYITDRLGEGGSGISYAEFSYSLIQGYDFWHLFKKHGVTLQIGGSDQWGNMLSGVPLIRKKESAEVHALSMPLVINKATGKKFGKSEDGAVWLDATKTSPFKFYQFWININDDAVEEYLKIYTELDKDAIDDIIDAHNEAPGLRLAQKHLAREVTSIVHSQPVALSVEKATEILYGGRAYQDLSTEDFEVLKSELKYDEGHEQPIADILVNNQLASSKTEARRFLDASAIYINSQQIPLSKTTIELSDAINGYVIVRRGKNQQLLYKITKQ